MILRQWLHGVTVGYGLGLGVEAGLDVEPLQAAPRVPELDVPVLPLVVVVSCLPLKKVLRVLLLKPLLKASRLMLKVKLA